MVKAVKPARLTKESETSKEFSIEPIESIEASIISSRVEVIQGSDRLIKTAKITKMEEEVEISVSKSDEEKSKAKEDEGFEKERVKVTLKSSKVAGVKKNKIIADKAVHDNDTKDAKQEKATPGSSKSKKRKRAESLASKPDNSSAKPIKAANVIKKGTELEETGSEANGKVSEIFEVYLSQSEIDEIEETVTKSKTKQKPESGENDASLSKRDSKVWKCEHKSDKRYCTYCDGRWLCKDHGKNKYSCKECGGVAYCKHGMQKQRCKECGGSALCIHDRQKAHCKECGGSAYCKHGKQKAQCKNCGGSALCVHGRQKYFCVECGGSAYCKHKKQKAKCQVCGENGSGDSEGSGEEVA